MKVIKFRGVHDIADELGVDVQTVRRWIHSGKLRAFKPGKEYRIQEADLEEFLRAREVRPKAPSRSSLEPSLLNGLEDERLEGTPDAPIVKESAATAHIQTTATAKLAEVLEDIEQGRIEEAAAKLRELIAA